MPWMYKYICLGVLFSFALGERTKDKMYDSIDGISACFRRLNGTHQIGCSSDRDGSTGVIHFVDAPSDLDFVVNVNNGLEYIPVIPIELFTRDLSDKLQSLEHISGLLIYDVENKTQKSGLSSYSPDLRCPNERSNRVGTCRRDWNPVGNALLMEDFKFPVFYLHKGKEVKKVRDCFVKFNNFDFDQHSQRSVCSIELQSFMFAAYDTPTCLRRSQSVVNMNPVKFCDSMGDHNVWASLFPMGNSSLTPKSYLKPGIKQILVVSRIDATSVFYNLEPGAQAAVTGMVTLLSIAELLKRMLPSYEGYNRNVLFILFNGESFDYIGSQRVVYDMKRGAYPRYEFTSAEEHSLPIRFEDIDTVLEISQLHKTEKLHLHLLNDTEQVEFTNILRKNLNVDIHSGVVPPTSIQSFIREKNPPKSLVLTDYSTNFSNSFYNSIYDNADNIDFVYHEMETEEDAKDLPRESLQVFLGGVVDGVSRSLYQAVTKREYDGEQQANLYYINELLYCYLESANCSIHRAINKGTFQPVPLSLYVSVTNSQNIITKLMMFTLAFFIGDQIGDGPCTPNMTSHIYYHFNMSRNATGPYQTQCYRLSINFTDAESPAFLIDGYDWSSGQYSTWTESVWREFNVRLFLKPARSHEIMTLMVGIIVFLLSLGVICCVNRKKDVLFEEIPTATPPTNC